MVYRGQSSISCFSNYLVVKHFAVVEVKLNDFQLLLPVFDIDAFVLQMTPSTFESIPVVLCFHVEKPKECY